MAERTPRLDLPWLMPAQAQKHVTVNEALARLDILVQAAVLSRVLGAQPDTPSEGEGYILPSSVTGADWAGAPEGVLIVFHEGVWTAIPPWPGMSVYVRDEACTLIHDGVSWRQASDQIRQLQGLEQLGVGASADSHNRLTVKSPGVLLSAEDGGSGDMRLVLNKAALANTTSLVFQSGWSGRAEFGLAGEDAFSVKVSEDGASWLEAIRVNPVEGLVTLTGLCVQSDRLQVSGSHTPASATAAGQAGQMCWDGGYLYVCVATDQWRRAALESW
ncbi:DUF2793 domain-containing protein [Oceanicaulis sp. MMSF_3324]|uniref:DUF2793 domain-containing protein n=1 Tax=Oceanicaulis sp. MMSF_3324 TaxID=3046702 RepID=UPI00273E33B9|nr:DUF2793 domain-containing protein [Oceanicaulis sp. MMSF_3324]